METSNHSSQGSSRKKIFNIIFQFFLILAVLGCGIALATYYLKTGPKPKPRKRQPNPPVVQVETIHFQDHQLEIEGMGTVVPAREISLIPGVSGEIVKINPHLEAGGRLLVGEVLINIDPIDYQLTVLELQNEVDIVNHEIELEMGNQRVAQKEFEILGEVVSKAEKNLMLREPQLRIKQASLKNKQAKLAQAKLNLKRTTVVAPFNSTVISTSVSLGSRVNQTSPMAKLVGTDEFWVKLLLPVEHLQWIKLPDKDDERGTKVRIYLDNRHNSTFREGKISKLAANLEEQGKLAIVYAVVKDPLALQEKHRNQPKLLLGSFVRVEIEGTTFENVLAIERNHLRENNSVWIMGNDDKLDIRPVEISARNKTKLFITNSLKDGERLIISALSAPVEGTKLRLLSKEKKKNFKNTAGNRKTPQQDPKSNN